MRDTGAVAFVAEHDVEAILADPDKVSLVAQPVVDLARGHVVGYELLARFSLGRPVGPDRVFAAAMRAGRGPALSALVVERALGIAARRPPDTFIAINVDPTDLGTPEIERVLGDGSLQGVVFELTEHYAFDDLTKLRQSLDELRRRGAIVALDDAGAGYSGLKQLLELKPEIVKLDRDLISGINHNEAKRALVQMLGELAGRFDAWVLAEGIETAEECDAIMKLGCPLGQGYFLGRPAPPWASTTAELATLVEATAKASKRSRRHVTLDRLVAPCVVTTRSTEWPTDSRITVHLDDTRRPTMLQIITEAGSRMRHTHELLRIKRDAQLTDVARRALARAERHRWDPLICVDDAGAFVGVVTVERMLDALVDTIDDAAAMPRITGSGMIPLVKS